MRKRIAIVPGLIFACLPAASGIAEESWSISSSSEWKQATASEERVVVKDGRVMLNAATQGQWTSKWHDWEAAVQSAKITVETDIDLFDNKTLKILVDGSATPYTDADGTPHDWYGRCMIAIIDGKRWIMALRSGIGHIGGRDTIHLLTSPDEGRTWNGLDLWFDGSPIKGMPYEDGHIHSEPGLFRMPNGDLILQFWRPWSSAAANKQLRSTDDGKAWEAATKQLRSTDDGKTWTTDIDQISVKGVSGAADNRVIGTEDYFVDPEHRTDIYMAFQYFHYTLPDGQRMTGSILAKSTDNCKTYNFLSWIAPFAKEDTPGSGAAFEPAIEYVGNRTIVAVMRDGSTEKHTWQSISTNMGASFSRPKDISNQIKGVVPNGLWQRARLYKESNPFFQFNNRLDYSKGEGRMWGFGIHSNGGGYTRKPVVYWSDDNGRSWQGPESLHGAMYPGTDTGYGDLKRRVNNTFVAATYYCNKGAHVADCEQYTFGGERARLLIETDGNRDGRPDAGSGWRELYNRGNVFSLSSLSASRWRIRLSLSSSEKSSTPKIGRVKIVVKKSRTGP